MLPLLVITLAPLYLGIICPCLNSMSGAIFLLLFFVCYLYALTKLQCEVNKINESHFKSIVHVYVQHVSCIQLSDVSLFINICTFEKKLNKKSSVPSICPGRKTDKTDTTMLKEFSNAYSIQFSTINSFVCLI